MQFPISKRTCFIVLNLQHLMLIRSMSFKQIPESNGCPSISPQGKMNPHPFHPWGQMDPPELNGCHFLLINQLQLDDRNSMVISAPSQMDAIFYHQVQFCRLTTEIPELFQVDDRNSSVISS